MRRLLLVASIASVLFSSNFGHAYAAGLYDGEWNGSARVVKNGRCRPANVTLTVLGNQAVGQAKFDLAVRNIAGTVRPDGTFGGTIGFQHLTGKFIEDKFEENFQSVDCACFGPVPMFECLDFFHWCFPLLLLCKLAASLPTP
jgi:hypothetical protein